MTTDSNPLDHDAWKEHIVRAGSHCKCPRDVPDPKEHRDYVEPWLAALLQAEHLNLLVGNGLTNSYRQYGGDLRRQHGLHTS